MECDLLIVGCGPVGCTVAERAAKRGWSSVIIDRRAHIAGNCFDSPYENGVLIHRYGPHYFRTNKRELIDYLSAFTGWIPGNYRVKSQVKGTLYPFPINLSTLEKFFGTTLNEASGAALIESLRERIEHPTNSEEFVLSKVGRELYEAFYLGYTLKQWSKHPRDLDPSVCGRIPVRLNRDDRYADAEFQVTPDRGFTSMFARMIESPLITKKLGVTFRDVSTAIRPRIATVYCGPLDEYFGSTFGPLPWRSLSFKYRIEKKEFVQPCVQINYPDAHDYTRSVEIKHVTGQKHQETVVAYEYAKATGEPYYPIPCVESKTLFEKYRTMAEEETRTKNVYFAGRLATYRYINTDQAIEEALQVFDTIVQDASHESSVGHHAGI